MAAEFGTQSQAVTFMVAGGLVFEIVAAMCSSPQTAEINAHSRADTLMKWVLIGLIVAALYIAVAVKIDKDRWPSILGGGIAGAVLWIAYAHAKSAGMKSNLPGTESDTISPGVYHGMGLCLVIVRGGFRYGGRLPVSLFP